MSKIITVWGNPGCGKSMFCCNLAKVLTAGKEKALIINADSSTPMLPVWMPERILEASASIGNVLTGLEINTALVAERVVLLKEYPFIGVMGYAAGENPFSYPELLARVKGLLRRYQVYRGKPETVQEEAEWCGLRVSLTANMVWRNDRELDLTDTEWRILRMLVQNRGKIFSMENLYESVWKETYFPSSSNTVMVHIRRLREKVEDDPRHPEYIKTVWGKGYRVG